MTAELKQSVLSVLCGWHEDYVLSHGLFWHGYAKLGYELKLLEYSNFQYIFRSALRQLLKEFLSLGIVTFVDLPNKENPAKPNKGYKLTTKGLNYRF